MPSWLPNTCLSQQIRCSGKHPSYAQNLAEVCPTGKLLDFFEQEKTHGYWSSYSSNWKCMCCVFLLGGKVLVLRGVAVHEMQAFHSQTTRLLRWREELRATRHTSAPLISDHVTCKENRRPCAERRCGKTRCCDIAEVSAYGQFHQFSAPLQLRLAHGLYSRGFLAAATLS